MVICCYDERGGDGSTEVIRKIETERFQLIEPEIRRGCSVLPYLLDASHPHTKEQRVEEDAVCLLLTSRVAVWNIVVTKSYFNLIVYLKWL